MNPETGKLEALLTSTFVNATTTLLRPNGEPVPSHWTIFSTGETVVLKDHTFKIVYMNEQTMILEPVPLELNIRYKKK